MIPSMKKIEIVAFLQSKWTSMNEELKLTYEIMANEHEK